MSFGPLELAKVQELVVDITKVKRNHSIPGTDINENVVEHCFSVAMLCWKIHDTLKPGLSLEKIFKYCLAHDFLERGLAQDTNTYASDQERLDKAKYEEKVLAELSAEFTDFNDMLAIIEDYENMVDEEARFVKTVDKMQAIILGEIDDWRPYKKVGVTHQEFTDKGESFMDFCPDCLKETLSELNTHSRKTFYDQPK